LKICMDDKSIVINKGWLVKSPPDLNRSIFRHIKRPKKLLPKWRRRYFELTISDSGRSLAYYNKPASSAGPNEKSSARSHRRLKGSIDLARVRSVAVRHRPPSNAMATLPTNLIPCRPRRQTGVGVDNDAYSEEAVSDSVADYSEEADWLQRCAFSVLVSGDPNRSRCDQRRYHFLADNPAAATRWVEALCRACGLHSAVDLGPAGLAAPVLAGAAAASAPSSSTEVAAAASEDYIYLSATTTSVFSSAAYAGRNPGIDSCDATASSSSFPVAEGYVNIPSERAPVASATTELRQQNNDVEKDESIGLGHANGLNCDGDAGDNSLPLPRRRRDTKSTSSNSSAPTDNDGDEIDTVGGLQFPANYAQLDIGEMRHASAEALAVTAALSSTVGGAKTSVAMPTVEYATVDAMRTLALAEMTSS
ncbi:hypothetical protein BOX15_Mlig018509g1, partial [Macrostomum lignano]